MAEAALANANRNPGRNTYLWRDAAWTMREAERAEQMPRGEGRLSAESRAFGDGRDILWGLPISVKDCFDLAGAPTTCGTTFYRDKNGSAAQDSWIVERRRARGAVITGKTHLHPLAYGITGENPDFGDCLQPGKQGALTGGSSSGAGASVMEGSAVAAIGTDTGGSVRVPAALCRLAGYRASIGRGDWKGGAHLSQSFDTLGWLFADVDATFAHGEFRVNAGNGDAIALAPTQTLTAGVGAAPQDLIAGAFTPFGGIRVKAIGDRAATQDGSLTAQGFTIVNAQAGVRWHAAPAWLDLEAGVDVQNVIVDPSSTDYTSAMLQAAALKPDTILLNFTKGGHIQSLAAAVLLFGALGMIVWRIVHGV